jgi:DNA-binding transcriptional regulator YdaS (Cro superfamily)
MTIWDRLRAACGTQAELARRVGLQPMAISQWKRRGRIPSEHVIAVERATGGQVTRFEIRPDLYPTERVA